MRERPEFCLEQEPEIAWGCFGGMEKGVQILFFGGWGGGSPDSYLTSTETLYSVHRHLLSA